MDSEPIPLFPDYAAIQRLYVGARSTVYRGRRIADGAPVVLKVVNNSDAALGESLALLRHELELLNAVRSERVIRGLAVTTFGADAMLVVQDIGGESLDRYLERGRFALADALGLAVGVAAGLRDVHAAGIIHRDVTPNNIVFNAATGECRLIDFDIATARRSEHHGFTAPRGLEGTLHYMAPEQTGRMNRITDSRADLYAFGVTLFELLTGRLPFIEHDSLAIVHAHLAVRPPALETIDATIPRPVSAIVAKLLAKAPEDRYQTAEALLADLQTCLARFTATGAIDDFELARHDVARHFELPSKLYGRAAELALLTQAFGRASSGAVETVLVAGHSGVGKTSVVRELFPLITRQRGYFLSGKFDQLRSEAPYPALVAAFDELTHQLLTEGEDELARWRDQITAAIAPNGKVVVAAIPALERIIGPQPPVVELDAASTQHRFRATLQRFMQVFTRKAHPLVLFLDDMQWADPESIQLLKLVAMSASTESFLLLQAFRDNEVAANHPLMLAAQELRAQRPVTQLTIAPLPRTEIAALVADTLHRDAASIEPLARLVCRKTDGNPFFVRQLLLALHEAGHIVFDAEARQFAFDVASIEDAPISENVADLLAQTLGKLPAPTRQVLAQAAAIGNRFDIDQLALVAGKSPTALHDELELAIDHELVLPLSELEYVISAYGAGLVFRRMRFQHDRIQRAAYGLMSPDEQRRMHLRIGELLAAHAGAELAERPFDVVSHLNRAFALIRDPADRLRLARLDVIAARKARTSAAYATAIDCLQIATAAFDWRESYQEQLDAHVLLAECAYHGGNTKLAHEVLDAAGDFATHDRDRATLDALRSRLYIHAADLKTALRYARRAASLRGCPLPETAEGARATLLATMAEIAARLDGYAPGAIEALLERPPMTDANALALLALFRHCAAAAFQTAPDLGALATALGVKLALEHGNAPGTAYAFTSFAGVLLQFERDDAATRFGKLGVSLIRLLDDRATRPAVELVYGITVAPWLRPIGEAIGYMREAGRGAREIGDHMVAGSAAAIEIMYRIFQGAEPLAEICRDARLYRQQCREVDETGSERLLGWQIDRMRVLMGELEAVGAEESSQSSLVVAREEANLIHQLSLLVMLVDIALANDDPATALDLATAARQLEPLVPRLFAVAEHQFLHAMAAIQMGRKRPALRGEVEPVIEANLRILRERAALCPSTFEALSLLVEAERLGPSGDLATSLALFDQATAAASRYGQRRLEAIANERHARCWIERGQPDIAQIYVLRARAQFSALGLHRKVRVLDRQHRGLGRGNPPARAHSTITARTSSDVLDVSAIAKATRAISGELELDKLLERMLEIIFENAGAEGGALVLDSPHGLEVAAARATGSPLSPGTPLGDAALPRSLVQYVHRTDSTVVLDDATGDPRFGNDIDIRARQPRSVLCMPIKHQDRALGVLYLENTLVSAAFTQARLEALSILASQIAVSLENATLFAARQAQAAAIARANDELRIEIVVREQAELELARYRAHLEELIAERTQELTHANQKLRDAAATRERMEAELRLAQKLESVGRLAAGVAHEINTPVQFVSDSLTFLREALPSLIGTIGEYRALVGAFEKCLAEQLALDDAKQLIVERVASVRASEDAADVDYALSHAPSALGNALDGLGRVAAIVRSMKDFAHPDRDEKTLVDLNRAIESTLMISANEYKYVADVHTELGALPLVRCNGGEINQAILNLVVNAAHAIRDVVGSSGDKGRITVKSRRDGDEIEIEISDTGTGIPSEIADKIYDPFFTTKAVGRGTGQGLAIVRGVVVDKHGGALRFDTSPGRGTTFFLRLPVGEECAATDSAA